jgi:hypothetical protein
MDTGMPRHGCAIDSLLDRAFNMIILSESSAEATQLVRTGCYTSARRGSSERRNDTVRYADAQRISVHTEALSGSIQD